MKKTILAISLLVLGLFLCMMAPKAAKLDIDVPDVVDGRDKVTMYVFRGEGCSHCYDLLEYFNEHASQFKDYFDIKLYEIWKNSDNSELKQAVSEELGNTENGVPFIVVGDQYKMGFSESGGEDIIKTALKEYENEDYKDVVAEVIKENNLENKPETLKEACEKEGIKVAGEEDKIELGDIAIITVILVVVVAGVAGLMYISKK